MIGQCMSRSRVVQWTFFAALKTSSARQALITTTLQMVATHCVQSVRYQSVVSVRHQSPNQSPAGLNFHYPMICGLATYQN